MPHCGIWRNLRRYKKFKPGVSHPAHPGCIPPLKKYVNDKFSGCNGAGAGVTGVFYEPVHGAAAGEAGADTALCDAGFTAWPKAVYVPAE